MKNTNSLSPKYVLGLSAYYHDSAAVLLADGVIVAAAHEERFTRKKHDPNFPHHAVRYVLDAVGAELSDMEAVVFYDKPLLKFERLLETYHAFAPLGLSSFLTAIPVWIKEKLFMRSLLEKELRVFGSGKIYPPPTLFRASSLARGFGLFPLAF